MPVEGAVSAREQRREREGESPSVTCAGDAWNTTTEPGGEQGGRFVDLYTNGTVLRLFKVIPRKR